MRAEGFRLVKHRFFGKTVLYEIPNERCWEIDDPIDFTIAETMLRKQLVQRHKHLLPVPVAAIIFDFDGVFTDNTVLVSQDGQEAVLCNRSDGLGLAQLKNIRLPIVVLSTECNPVVDARCKKLGIICYQSLDNKVATLRSLLKDMNIDSNQVIYVGNDMNDRECMQAVGCSIAVADAHPSLLPYAKIVLENRGGHGAVRELCELLLTHMTMTNTLVDTVDTILTET